MKLKQNFKIKRLELLNSEKLSLDEQNFLLFVLKKTKENFKTHTNNTILNSDIANEIKVGINKPTKIRRSLIDKGYLDTRDVSVGRGFVLDYFLDWRQLEGDNFIKILN